MSKIGPDSINLDYRVVALLLTLATRGDLLEKYINDKDKPEGDPTKWKSLLGLGFRSEMLAESVYLFDNDQSKKALERTQKVMKTLVNLNDYCDFFCPSDAILRHIIDYTTGLQEPLQAASIGRTYAENQ